MTPTEYDIFRQQWSYRVGNVRVGLEDSIYLGKGKLAKSNAEQVKKIRKILEELGMEIAKPDDTRKILKLKGSDMVNFNTFYI